MWTEHEEKGAEIYNKCLTFITSSDKLSAKACAGICVDEIMKDAKANWGVGEDKYEDSHHFKYWSKVMEAIQKI